MIDRLLMRLAIDAVQFRALLRTSLRVDFRTGIFSSSRRKPSKRRFPGLWQIAVFYGFLGMVLSFMIIENSDLFFTGTVMMTIVMFAIAASVLVEFQSVVVTPDDYQVLAHRPISSRTFFASRMANLMTYLGVITFAIGLIPAIVYSFRYGFQPQLGLALLLGMFGAALLVSLFIVFLYVNLMRVVHPKKLRRMFSYLQLVLSFMVYGSGMIFSILLDEHVITSMQLHHEAWMLVLPPTWFSALLQLAAGGNVWLNLASVLTGTGMILLLVSYAYGRLSLEYAAILSRLDESSEGSKRNGRRLKTATPLFGRNEGRAAALLIRNQYKYDMKFRMSVLAILPLTILYLITGLSAGGGLADPFVNPSEHVEKAILLYIAMAFFPVLLLASMARSDAWQASWIFHATPSDKGKLVLAMKDVLMVFFVLPYVFGLGVLFALYFESLQHVVIHMLILSLLSHLIMQVLVMANPYLPFSRPLRKGEKTAGVFVGILAAAVCMWVIINVLAYLVYPSQIATGVTLVTLATMTVIFEKLAAERVRRRSRLFQFEL
jgi:ABC-2 type transport system permease protein